jgi:hypothetical protein
MTLRTRSSSISICPISFPAIAGRELELQFSPQCLRISCRNSALTQEAQLVFGHRALRDGDIPPKNSPLTF